MAESYASAESVTAMARRHGLRHTQPFTLRREMRQVMEAAGVALPVAVAPEPLFMPAVIEPEPVAAAVPKKKRARRARPAPRSSSSLTAWR